jgi:hypothetical protein
MGEGRRRGLGLGGRVGTHAAAACSLLRMRIGHAGLARAGAATLAVCAAVLTCSGPAFAEQLASISAGFAPYRLGKPTSVSLGFSITTPDGGLPAALTGLVFRYPRQLVLGASELGLDSCPTQRLEVHGPKDCPPNSIMGSGTALAQFQVSPIVSEEKAKIALVAGPSKKGYVEMLIAATGAYPVQARIVMETLLLPGRLKFSVPLVPGIPEGPDVAVVKVDVTIGGRLIYYERRHGRRIPYIPRGIALPSRCPKGGFHFGATFSFVDGSAADANTVVPCPRRSNRR